MINFKKEFPNYDVDKYGVVYRNGLVLKPFKSNKYLQVLLFDINRKRHVFGIHQVVAMKYLPEYQKGCVVHHKDGNPRNNNLENLEVLTRQTHAYLHNKDSRLLADYVKMNGPANKGKKMSKEFCEKCSKSAKLRGFNGNQFIDKNRNKRT